MTDTTPFLILLTGSVIAFAMLFSLGGNDVANSIGVAIGSNAISMRSAVTLAALMNILGASLAGSRVTSTIADDVVPSLAKDTTLTANALAYLVTLLSAVIVIASGTLLKLPLSSTHAVVGGLIGAGILLYESHAVQWNFVHEIVLAWVTSPLLGGVICLLIRVVLLMASRNSKAYAAFVPLLGGANAVGALCVLLFLGPVQVKEVLAPNIGLLVAEVALVFGGAFLVALVYVGHKTGVDVDGGGKTEVDPLLIDPFKMDENADVFKAFLVLTVPAVAFAHGSNDVSNGVGPFLGILRYFLVVTGRSESQTLVMLVLLAGGVAIGMGIALFGYHVIDTIGRGGIYTAEWTFAKAFAAQAAAAVAVLVASFFGLPVSTSHTIVGAVICAGIPIGMDGGGEPESMGLNGKMVRNIALGAILTPLLAGVLAALLMYVASITVLER